MTSWIVGRQVHVLDVWESQSKLDAFFEETLGQLLEESGLELAEPPEIGDVVQVVAPPRGDGAGA